MIHMQHRQDTTQKLTTEYEKMVRICCSKRHHWAYCVLVSKNNIEKLFLCVSVYNIG